jgi:hypothetical protein
VEKLNERDHLKYLGTDEIIILKWILTRMGGFGLDGSGQG